MRDRAHAQSYDHLAGHFEELTALHPDPVADWLPAVLPGGRRALDVGCGGGRHTVHLAKAYDEVVAVDLSGEMIELARTTRPAPNVDYRVTDLFAVSGSFDLVFSSAMLHHVEDLGPALAHLRALVAPGGAAVLVDVTAPASPLLRLPLRLVPRLSYRAGAGLHWLADVLRRRPGAWRRHRLQTHRGWIEHLATDRFLTSAQFDATYSEAFPGAEIISLGHLRACVWASV